MIAELTAVRKEKRKEFFLKKVLKFFLKQSFHVTNHVTIICYDIDVPRRYGSLMVAVG